MQRPRVIVLSLIYCRVSSDQHEHDELPCVIRTVPGRNDEEVPKYLEQYTISEHREHAGIVFYLLL